LEGNITKLGLYSRIATTTNSGDSKSKPVRQGTNSTVCLKAVEYKECNAAAIIMLKQ